MKVLSLEQRVEGKTRNWGIRRLIPLIYCGSVLLDSATTITVSNAAHAAGVTASEDNAIAAAVMNQFGVGMGSGMFAAGEAAITTVLLAYTHGFAKKVMYGLMGLNGVTHISAGVNNAIQLSKLDGKLSALEEAYLSVYNMVSSPIMDASNQGYHIIANLASKLF